MMCECGHDKANHAEGEGYCRKCHHCLVFLADGELVDMVEEDG